MVILDRTLALGTCNTTFLFLLYHQLLFLKWIVPFGSRMCSNITHLKNKAKLSSPPMRPSHRFPLLCRLPQPSSSKLSTLTVSAGFLASFFSQPTLGVEFFTHLLHGTLVFIQVSKLSANSLCSCHPVPWQPVAQLATPLLNAHSPDVPVFPPTSLATPLSHLLAAFPLLNLSMLENAGTCSSPSSLPYLDFLPVPAHPAP